MNVGRIMFLAMVTGGGGKWVTQRAEWIELQTGKPCLRAPLDSRKIPTNDPVFLLERFKPSIIFVQWPLGSEWEFDTARELVGSIFQSVEQQRASCYPLLVLVSDDSAVHEEAARLGVRAVSDDVAGFKMILKKASILLPELLNGPTILIPHT